jgi:hypothetical protein
MEGQRTPMRRLASIFGDPSTPTPGGIDTRVQSFSVAGADGPLCLVRLTFAAEEALYSDPIALHAGEDAFVPVEESGDDHTIGFLIPSAALESRFEIQLGETRHSLPSPTSVPEQADTRSVARAYLAQQAHFVEHAERLASLRAAVRSERERTAAAQEELEEARGNFDQALLGQRSDQRALSEKLAELEAALAEERARRAELEGELGVAVDPLREAIAELTRERDGLRAELEQEQAQREELQVNLATAQQQAMASDRQLHSLREEEGLSRKAAQDHQSRLAQERGRRTILESSLEDATEQISAATEALAALKDREASAVAERDELQATLVEEQAASATTRSELEAARTALADANAERSYADAARMTQLEAEVKKADQQRESAASALGKVEAALGNQREVVDDLTARLEATQSALSETRSARYRAEQQVQDLRAELDARGGTQPPARDDEGTDFTREVLEASDDAPDLSVESLRKLSFDGLAEVYDIAADAWRTHGRTGNIEQAERWRAIAHAVVHEGSKRDDAEANGADRKGPLRVRGRHGRLREQLQEAIAAR